MDSDIKYRGMNMTILNNPMKRIIGVLTAIALLFVMLFNFNIGFLRAEATVSNTHVSYPITFYVPETIYLNPSDTAASTFKYYVDCETNGNLNANNADTTGKVYFNCAAATSCSIACEGAAVAMGANTGTNTIDTNITAGTIVAPLSPGKTSLLKWTVTYTVNGETRTAKAYTVCYAPVIDEVAAGIRHAHTYSTDVFNQGILWLIGLHSFSGGSHKCVKNFFTDSAPTNNTGLEPWFQSSSGGGAGFRSESHSSNAGDDERVTGGTANITVDSSRYTNLNQIPNLKLGFWQCDVEGDGTVNGWIKQSVDSVETHLFSLNNVGLGCHYSNSINYLNTQGLYGTKHIDFSAYSENNRGSRWNRNHYNIDLSVTYTNKTYLRSQVRACIQAGLQEADYSPSSWSTYSNTLADAAEILGNPTKTDVSNIAATLLNAFSSLSKTTKSVVITHLLPCPVGATGLVDGMLKDDSADGSNDGYFTITESLTFESSDTVYFSPNNYTGYTVVSASGSTTSIAPQSFRNSRNDIDVVYLYSANQYTVTLNYGTDPLGGQGHQLYTSTYNKSSITVKYNHSYASAGLPSSPTMAGWSFGGWYHSQNYSYRVMGGDLMTASEAHTIYAKWAPYFSGGHGFKAGNTINGTVLNYDDMFLISNSSDLDKIDQYNSTYNYSTSSGFSYKQIAGITAN